MKANTVVKNEFENDQPIRSSGVHTSNVQMYASRDLRFIYHRILGGRTISQHVNYYKRILDVPFTPQQRSVIPLPIEDRPKPFIGYTGTVKVRKSYDGEYLIHIWGDGERITLPAKLYFELIARIDAQLADKSVSVAKGQQTTKAKLQSTK